MKYALYEGTNFVAWIDAQRIPAVGELLAFYDKTGTLVERSVTSVRTKIDGVTTDAVSPREAVTHVIVT